MKKKITFVFSFALATLLVVGQFSYAEKSDSMMKMMEAMNSPEGQKMMKACGEFMESYNNKAE